MPKLSKQFNSVRNQFARGSSFNYPKSTPCSLPFPINPLLNPQLLKKNINMTTIGKKSLVQRVAKNTKISQVQVETILNELLVQTKQALIRGEEIKFIGYFSFRTMVTSPRMARNLQTGKKMKVPAKRVPKCKFSLGLKEEVAKKK